MADESPALSDISKADLIVFRQKLLDAAAELEKIEVPAPNEDLDLVLTMLDEVTDPLFAFVYPPDTDEEREARERERQAELVASGLDEVLRSVRVRAETLASTIITMRRMGGLASLARDPAIRFRAAADELLARAPKEATE